MKITSVSQQTKKAKTLETLRSLTPKTRMAVLKAAMEQKDMSREQKKAST